jgi:hypothetical protein
MAPPFRYAYPLETSKNRISNGGRGSTLARAAQKTRERLSAHAGFLEHLKRNCSGFEGLDRWASPTF